MELKNGSTLDAKELSLLNMQDTNFNIEANNIVAKKLTANKTTLNLTELKFKDLEQTDIYATNYSKISIDTWDTAKMDKLATDSSSKFMFKKLKFDMLDSDKEVKANTHIKEVLELKNIGLANDAMENEFKPNVLKFTNELSFSDALKIDLSFSEALKGRIDKIDYNKGYEILTARAIAGGVKPIVNLDLNNLYATGLIEGNAIKVKFTKDKPSSQANQHNSAQDNAISKQTNQNHATSNTANNRASSQASQKNVNPPSGSMAGNMPSNPKGHNAPSGNAAAGKKPSKNSDVANIYVKFGIGADLKNEAVIEFVKKIKQIAYTQDSKSLNELIKKTKNELKTINESSNTRIADTMLLSNNTNINQRISHVKLATPKLTMQNAFKYALASGESDAQSSLSKVMNAIEADKARNSFWYSANGGYLDEGKNGGDIKYYGSSFGYDRSYDLSNGSMIYGVMFGANKAKYENKNYQDVSKAYNLGIYADYESINNHEFQTNLNLVHIKSDKKFVVLSKAQNATNSGYGVLLSSYYKYRFDLAQSGTYAHSVKPVFLLEVGHSNIGAFVSKDYKQDKIKNTTTSLGLGGEYTMVSQNQAHTIQAIVKKNVYETNDSAKVNLSGAKSYLEYSLKDKPVSYELNYIGETRLTDSFIFQYAVGGTADSDGGHGGKASLKLEYKF